MVAYVKTKVQWQIWDILQGLSSIGKKNLARKVLGWYDK